MKCNEILEYLNNLYPPELAMDWDNSGFLLGRKDAEVKRILIVLDITNSVLDYAKEKKIDLIISHHPVIFSSIKRITNETLLGNYILEILENNISVIAVHTNFDIANGGMADIAKEKLSLTNTRPLEVTAIKDGKELGVGKIGDLKKALSLDELVSLIKEKFNLEKVAVFGRENIKGKISRIAVSPGSGKGMYKHALAEADVLITGDITHHEGLDASNEGICIIDATHYGLEHIFIEKIENDLKKFDEINIFKFKNTDPVEIV
jgi:dinuclear metal center protein, YbgI family